jgi:hypothetical protein
MKKRNYQRSISAHLLLSSRRDRRIKKSSFFSLLLSSLKIDVGSEMMDAN